MLFVSLKTFYWVKRYCRSKSLVTSLLKLQIRVKIQFPFVCLTIKSVLVVLWGYAFVLKTVENKIAISVSDSYLGKYILTSKMEILYRNFDAQILYIYSYGIILLQGVCLYILKDIGSILNWEKQS